jgi:hypothetical protein
MGLRPWMTSRELIDSVKRKIAIPINQRTFTEEDILAFANEELMLSQVPDIMQYHEEFFVHSQDIPLVADQNRYEVPERAIGGKFRDIFFLDNNGNLFDMVRVNADDKAYWQRETGSNGVAYKYYLEGNDLVLSPKDSPTPFGGSLRLSYFLRPNQLVLNERAAISQSFFKNIVVDNTTLVAGDVISVGNLAFTAVSGVPTSLQFQIGASSILSASNLVNSINNDGTYSASNGSPSTTTVNIQYSQLSLVIASTNSSALAVSTQVGIKFTENLPSNFVDGMIIDFLQTKPGHRTAGMDVQLSTNSISDDSILFNANVIPEKFIIGDYVCEQYECIIPQIPPDLHNGLAERICSRILSAQSDMVGLQISQAKIADIKRAEGILTDNRVDGSTQKLTQRHSMIGYQRMGVKRRV